IGHCTGNSGTRTDYYRVAAPVALAGLAAAAASVVVAAAESRIPARLGRPGPLAVRSAYKPLLVAPMLRACSACPAACAHVVIPSVPLVTYTAEPAFGYRSTSIHDGG